MPSVLSARRAAVAAALCLVATGCAAGQLNQQQKERVVADSGYASRNDMSLQAVFLAGPVSAGSPVVGHFVAVNSAKQADVLTAVTTSIGSATLTSGPSGSPVSTATVPGGQGVSPVNYFSVTAPATAPLVGSLFTASFTFRFAGVIDVTGTVVDGQPGAYSGGSQEQRGQCLDLIGPNGQGGNQLEHLQSTQTATPSPPAFCATPEPAPGDGVLTSTPPTSSTDPSTSGTVPSGTVPSGTVPSGTVPSGTVSTGPTTETTPVASPTQSSK